MDRQLPVTEEQVTDVLVNRIPPCPVPGATFAWLYKFACAVAEEAVKQEREMCALECERVYGSDERGAKACAALIRGRSEG